MWLRHLALSLALALSLRADLKTDIDTFARKAMTQLGTTPGLTVVVVRNDKVVYTGDFGYRDLERKLPVTPDTRFYLASTTKAFTAMAAAILAGDAKLDLDAPVASVWPEQQLTAPLDPKRLSLRDFLAMRSGVGNDTANFRMEIGNVDDAELLRLLATYSREEPRTFRYSNVSYVIAGKLLEKAGGKPWFELVTETILEPLGMSTTSIDPPAQAIPAATSYRTDSSGRFVAIPSGLTPIAGPAGSMLSTRGDMAKWLIAMLQEGRIADRQVLPKRAIRQVTAPQTTNKRRFRYFDRYAWALGYDIADYEGDLFVHRFGGLDGAYSHVSFMPERNIAVAAFANGGGAVPDAVAAFAYDLLLGKKDVHAKWEQELARVAETIGKDRDERRKAEAALESGRRDPAHPRSAYTGIYRMDRLGEIRVSLDGKRLAADFGIRRAELIETGDDTFAADWSGTGQTARLQFVFEGDVPVKIDWGGRIFERLREK